MMEICEDGISATVERRSSKMGSAFEGCFSYRMAYKATRRSLLDGGMEGD